MHLRELQNPRYVPIREKGRAGNLLGLTVITVKKKPEPHLS